MQDFNEFSKNNNSTQNNLFELVKNISKKFDGKSQNELFKAIYEEALKGKKNGTLTNEQIENFRNILYPLIDQKKRAYLDKIVDELKKI